MPHGDVLLRELEGVYYREADLLDDREFEQWLEMLDDDLVYWMPLVRNVSSRESGEFSQQGTDMSWFDEDKVTLGKRIAQLKTGMHWSEEPVSRVTRMISNIRIVDERDEGREVTVRSKFILYQNRQDDEVNMFVGKRRDTWRRRPAGSWGLVRRDIILDQNVLLAKSLSVFF
ncbi:MULTISPECIES: 3-phenylpropionate/cinnamic acid dioxygenase subunit beta [Rhodococcus]|uniref:3-phenylpropionate/cinnamic acid dioxygenase subunit beta n=1 Tax=Rhodococcus globerulus TaxID=33008 RepID=A0ABU4BYI1_RHOGO|nr:MULTISPECIES: 3-phenylpropionate/cinnamic acid dioxygenase subunit beta [Rhodococcus]MDV6269302.1 3-phenylpropionate/cinnamic acid dioxygenase subunit beta [Rhodococcus globerulus]MDV8066651.1 3-phenylpropionate/cinnamic acid dioxygenase subunit beta [Rhodococcus sp. IEGM 1366]